MNKMKFATLLLHLFLLYGALESNGYLIEKTCQIFRLCELQPSPGKRVSKPMLERMRDRVESTKEKFLSIQLKNALRAEKERFKWRQKADRYCEAPEHKIKKAMGCEDLHMTHENYQYYDELKKFCRKLLQAAESGSDNEKLIEAVNECEKKAHSRDVFQRIQNLRSNLQQRCRWEQKRKSAMRRVRLYEKKAKKLRLDAKKFEKLIEKSVKIEEDRGLEVDLAPDQLQQIVRVLEQQHKESIDDDLEVDEENEEEGGEETRNPNAESIELVDKPQREQVDDDLNDLVELISRQVKDEDQQKSSEEAAVKRCKHSKNTTPKCSDKKAVALTKSEIGRILKFLNKEEQEDLEEEQETPCRKVGQKSHCPKDDVEILEQLKKNIEDELKAKTNSEESSEEIIEVCGHKKPRKQAPKCGKKVNLEFPEDGVEKLLKLLTKPAKKAKSKKRKPAKLSKIEMALEPEPEAEPKPKPETVVQQPAPNAHRGAIQVHAHASVTL